MPKIRAHFEALKAYLPAGSFEPVMDLIERHKVHLTISKERQTKLGDYRHAWHHENHRISVNGNLNVYAFLITLLHELAHLLAFEQFGGRIPAHGKEWKMLYSQLLKWYIDNGIFPDDIAHELKRMLGNPAATTAGEDDLQRVLRKYDERKPGHATVEDLPEGVQFKLSDGRVFVRGKQIRKRIRCIEWPSQRIYLFHPLYEVLTA